MKAIRREGLAVVLLLALSHSPLHAAAMPQGTWTQVATTGPAYNIFTPPSMAYDSLHSRTVLVGGATGGETWLWDGISWTQRPGLPSRTNHAIAYDSQRGRTVLFGGKGTNGNSLGDTWEWDGTVWTLVSTIGPAARDSHAMAYDTQRGATVLFGGEGTNGNSLGDTWEWDGNTWVQVASTGPGRTNPGMAYDSLRGKTVLHGGYLFYSMSDTWEWDGSTWTPVSTSGPAIGLGKGMVFDGVRIVVTASGSLAMWSGAPWTTLPSTPVGGAAAYDSARGKVVLVGFSTPPGGPVVPGTFELDQLAPPAFTPFGTGCLGPNGLVPSLAGVPGEAPIAGRTSRVRVTNLPLAPTIPVFVIGLSNTWDPDGYGLPVDLGVLGWPGCPQLVADQGIYWTITTTGEASQGIAIPPGYPIGFTFYVQTMVLYSSFPPQPSDPVAVSNAVAGIVGY